MSYTEKLVDLIVEFKKDAVPEDVIEHTKLYVLDNIGCAVGGYATKQGREIVEQAKDLGGGGSSTIFVDGGKISAPFACWANSSLSNVLDMDDVFAGTAHQGNCLIPTAFGLGEMKGASGLDVIHAIILGFEVGSRIMMYSWPSPAMEGQYFPSTWQVFDAVTVTANLLRMERKEIYHAFGLAGTVPPVPIDMSKFVEKPMGFAKNPFGWTTFTGVFWTLMAQKGTEGVPNIFDGDSGFWKIMGSDYRDFDKLLEGFGEKYNITETKYKPYPLCTWGHTSVDTVKKVFSENNIEPDAIQEIKVKTINRATEFLSGIDLESIYDAQFSLPHAIAMMILGKAPGPEWMTEENLFGNEKARELAKKVRIVTDPWAEKIADEEKGVAIPSSVEVTMYDGTMFSDSLKYSKGTTENPFTADELKQKFLGLASSVYSREKVLQILETIENLDKVDKISQLTTLLVP